MKRKVISVVSTKGGTGKSVCVVNIAVAAALAGRKVVIIDADPQQSCSRWYAHRKKHLNLAEIDISPWNSAEMGNMHEVIPTLSDNWDFVIIDVRGSDSAEIRSALIASDLVVVPTSPSPEDLEILQHVTIPILDQWHDLAGADAVGAIIINRWKWSCNLHKSVTSRLAALVKNFPICDTKLCDRIVYQSARGEGKGVIEYEPKGGAAKEVMALYTELMGLINA